MPVAHEIPSGWGPGASSSQAHIATAAEAEVLGALRAAGGSSTVAELAQSLGAHRNTVREHLSALAARGAVERQVVPGGARGRPAHRYVLAPAPAEAAVAALLGVLATTVAQSAPDPTGEAVRLGRIWAERLPGAGGRPDLADPAEPSRDIDRRRRLVDILARLGFDPDADDRVRRLRLTRCPFVTVARDQPQVVCGVHLGLMEGVLAGPDGEVRLDAFAERGACVVSFPGRRAQPGGSSESSSSASTIR